MVKLYWFYLYFCRKVLDENILKSINEEITQEGTDEAIKEGMNAKGKKLSKETKDKITTWELE